MKSQKFQLIKALMVMLSLDYVNGIGVKAEEIKGKEMAQLVSGEREEVEKRNSYLGLGGNISAGGDTTALGNGGMVILGKVGLMKYLSVDATAIINNKIGGSVAITGTLPIVNKTTNKLIASPFVGGGILIHDQIDPLATAGVNVPLTPDLTGILKVDVGFAEQEAEVGIMLGIGYNFDLF